MKVFNVGTPRSLAILFGLCPILAVGAPAISGVSGSLSQGQTITISGSGFGTKATAAPLVWDDFEGGSVGSSVQDTRAVVGAWDSNDGSRHVTYSAASPYAGRQSTFHDYGAWWASSLAKNFEFTRLYMDFWIKVDLVDQKSRNWKLWRFYGDNDAKQLAFVQMCNGPVMPVNGSGVAETDWTGTSYTSGQWMHVQLVYQESAPGQANGVIRHSVNSARAGFDSTSVMTRATNVVFNQVRIGHYWSTEAADGCAASSPGKVYVDNVYLDTSWNRVELGNAPTYAASTVREILVPSAWNDGSITATVNLGRFTSGSDVYLYVVDGNNVPTSSGVKLTVGSNSAYSRPNPPSAILVE